MILISVVPQMFNSIPRYLKWLTCHIAWRIIQTDATHGSIRLFRYCYCEGFLGVDLHSNLFTSVIDCVVLLLTVFRMCCRFSLEVANSAVSSAYRRCLSFCLPLRYLLCHSHNVFTVIDNRYGDRTQPYITPL